MPASHPQFTPETHLPGWGISGLAVSLQLPLWVGFCILEFSRMMFTVLFGRFGVGMAALQSQRTAVDMSLQLFRSSTQIRQELSLALALVPAKTSAPIKMSASADWPC